MTPSFVTIKVWVCVVAFMVAALAPASAADFSARRGLNLDQWVTWPMEDRWHEEDALFPFPEWRRFVSAEKLQQLKSDGFDFLRMPVDPAPFLSARSEVFHDRLFQDMRAAVEEINAAGLNVIVDLHLIERNDNPDNGMAGVLGSAETFERYLEIVKRTGEILADRDPKTVALELMNEPGTACDVAGNEDWRNRLARLHKTARTAAPDLTLVLTGGCAGTADGLMAIDPRTIDDDNVIWSFHSYQPFLLTHQGAMWAGDFIRYVTGLSYPLDASTPRIREEIRKRIIKDAPIARRPGMLAYLDEQLASLDTADELRNLVEAPFNLVSDWAAHYQIAPQAILLGEFGMIRQEYQNPFIMPAASRANYVREVIGLAEKHGFGWAIWSYGGAFGVVESFDGKPAEPDILDVVRDLKQ